MSIYKRFRTPNSVVPGSLLSRYDQPSYISFRLIFAQNFDMNYNDAGKLTNSTLNYDIMPHPLFGLEGEDNINDRETYSAIDYLLDANEPTRAAMLEEFINKFNELQNNFQWYFKSVEGLDELIKVDTDYGRRVQSDKRLTITTLEGIDLRVSHLLNLYRKIAWDDTYQRWVLPDMMRYFTLKIYITEFRTFHEAGKTLTSEMKVDDIALTVLDDVLPTWVINCEMCEFDLETIKFNYLGALDVSEVPGEATTTFGIKVGKIHETQIYPLFRNTYLIDKALNGADRLKSLDGDIPFDSTSKAFNNNTTKNMYANRVAQNSIYDSDVENFHVSSLPFNQNANDRTLIESADTNKDTWISNALTSGVALATNYANQWIDKLKMTPIPGLGASVTEMGAALESKNIFSVIGTVRKAITTVHNDQIEPSEELGTDIITDATFNAFLQGLSKSTATSKQHADLIYAANIALNDKGVWEALKDYSKATNMIAGNEVNIPAKIEGSDIYNNNTVINTANDRSKATDLDGGVTNINSTINQPEDRSMATDLDGGRTNINSTINQPNDRSMATDLDGGKTNINNELTQPKYTSTANNGNIINAGLNVPEDRSMATDLDGGKTSISSELIMPKYTSTANNNKLIL